MDTDTRPVLADKTNGTKLMCDPMAIISAVAMVGGSVLNSMGWQQASDARAQVTRNQTNLQAQHQKAEHAAFQSSLDMAAPDKVKAEADAAAAQRAAAYAPAPIAAPEAAMPGTGTGLSEATRNAVIASNDKATADATKVGTGRAGMGGAGDAFRNLSFAMQPNVDKIAIENNFSKGDAALFPLELDNANRAGSGLRQLGSLFSGLGGSALAGQGLAAAGFGGLGGGVASKGGLGGLWNSAVDYFGGTSGALKGAG